MIGGTDHHEFIYSSWFLISHKCFLLNIHHTCLKTRDRVSSTLSAYNKYSVLYRIPPEPINTLRLKQNGRYFADDIFRYIFLNENVWILIKISLQFAPKGPINNIPALVQIMAWRRPGDKPLSEPMMVRSSTHILVTRPQWVELISDTRDLLNTGSENNKLTQPVQTNSN